MYDDFLPGVLEAIKSDKGYVACRGSSTCASLWYRQGPAREGRRRSVPTDWDELLTAGKALKKIGVFGFATGAGAGNNLGAHTMVAMMINNGGGLFTPDGKPDCVNDRNVEAMDFVSELVNEGIIDPAAVSYTTDNLNAQWNDRKVAFGLSTVPSRRARRRRRGGPGGGQPDRRPARRQGRPRLRQQHHDVHQHPVAGRRPRRS